jgi:tRNA uridine 5-carbamoylmethylation protein Kti12
LSDAVAADPVLIVSGPPGSGKTATARALAESRERSVHLESDEFFHFIASGYVKPWKPAAHEQNTVVMGAVAEAAAHYAQAGYFTIVDAMVSPRWFLEPLRDSFRAAGLRVAYAVLRPPLAVCVARAGERERRPLAEAKVIEQLWSDIADLGPLERHVVEPGEMTVRQVADLLDERLAAGQLAA